VHQIVSNHKTVHVRHQPSERSAERAARGEARRCSTTCDSATQPSPVCTPHGRLLPVVLGAVSPCALGGIHRLHWVRRLLHQRRSWRRVLTLLWGGERACEGERAKERPVQGGGAGNLCRRAIQLLTETTLVHATSARRRVKRTTRAEQPDPVAPARIVQPQQTRGEREGLRRDQHAVEHSVHVVHHYTALHYPATVTRYYYSKSSCSSESSSSSSATTSKNVRGSHSM
jgi:hypothetical protein